MSIFDTSPCKTCSHASAIHQIGSVCGAMHCYCRAFEVAYDDEPTDQQTARGPYVMDGRSENARTL